MTGNHVFLMEIGYHARMRRCRATGIYDVKLNEVTPLLRYFFIAPFSF